MSVRSGLAKLPVSGRDELKILFDAESPNVDKLYKIFFVLDFVLCPIARNPVAWMEALHIDPAVEEENLPLSQSAFVKKLGGGSRWDDYFVHGVIESHHVLPGKRLQTHVPRVVLHILGNIGVV